MVKVKPFLRWAGGKAKLINHLIKFIPSDYKFRPYYEPFLGAGSLFFALTPPKAILSDINAHLIHCYKFIKKNPSLILNYLMNDYRMHSEEYYYETRFLYNKNITSARQAARFIYLNKTSFNGIFRVNEKGEYNVPFGKILNPALPINGELKAISFALKKTKLLIDSYTNVLNKVEANSFIYLDPPYPPLNKTSFFNHYSKDRFSNDNQQELAEIAQKLSDRNCLILLSNADIPLIRKLYKRWNIHEISTTRWVSCKSSRHKVKELIITNY